MPLKGFYCAAYTGRGEPPKVSFEKCQQCAATTKNKCHYTEAMIKAILKFQYPPSKKKKSTGVTALLGCLRSSILRKRLDYWQSPEDLYYMFRGQLIHSILEGYPSLGGEIEQFYSRNIAGWTVVGKLDLIIPDKKLIRDYKTVRQIPAYQYPYKKDTLQLNIYKWLLEDKHEIDRLEAVYLDMSKPKRCNAKIMPKAEVEALIKEKLALLDEALAADALPNTEFGRNWMCPNYCPVSEDCFRLWTEEIREKGVQEGLDAMKDSEAEPLDLDSVNSSLITGEGAE